MSRGPVYVVGDVHGHLDRLVAGLGDAGLLTPEAAWAGGDSTLWFIGDLFDRGPDGILALDLVMRLEREAADSGGAVRMLLGNHEVLILSVHRFYKPPTEDVGIAFVLDWMLNGGRPSDLAGLGPEHVEWLCERPCLALEGDALLVHADSTFYTRYGRSVEEVNERVRSILRSDDARAWGQLLSDFTERHAFDDGSPSGRMRAESFLRTFGGRRLVHGHTPIPGVTGAPPETVRRPHVYANGLCVNVDGGMYLGGPGFVYRLPGCG